jgi:membrane protease YdiL (CAAX protease family)
MMPAISSGQAIWLLTRMRVRRTFNQINGQFFRSLSRKKKAKARDGTSKAKTGWVLALVMAALMGFSFTVMSRSIVLSMECKLDLPTVCTHLDSEGYKVRNMEFAADALHAAPFVPHLVSGLTMLLTILFAVSVLIPLAGRELAQADWDLEWLATMPVQRRALLFGRILGRAASNSVGLLTMAPPLAIIGWYSSFGWATVPVALLATALLQLLAATLHTLADTGLRMWLSAAKLRNLQALASLCSLPMIYLVTSLNNGFGNSFTMAWAAAYPAWTVWTPPGVLIQLLQAQGMMQALPLAALLLLQSAALVWGGLALMNFQLRHGVTSDGARESVRRSATSAAAISAAAPARASFGAWLSPIKRRELRLLSRDRNFLVQTLLLPVVIVGSQMLFNGALSHISQLGHNPGMMSAIAYGIGVYVLMLSAFQNLATEGQALWLLYCFPRSLESTLREKAQLWGVLAMIYPVAVYAIGFHYGAQLDARLALMMLVVLAGVPIFSVIAVALGIFGCDPLATEARNRMHPTYVNLYMMLCAFYGYAVYSKVWSQQVVIFVLMASLALALWQKARDNLPYLLDAGMAPPARVSTADGLMAATLFFILQALAILLFSDPAAPSPQVVVSAFGGAGLVVYLLARLVYWLKGTAGVPVMLRGGQLSTILRYGAGLALPAVLIALAYTTELRHAGLWPVQTAQAAVPLSVRAWVMVLTVCAAPLCEEFIFRGLIYGGLRRSMGALPAMLASAALFAAVHPPLSMLPVFGLGLAAAYAYERSKVLAAPMLAHALYNAAVLVWQWQ